MKKVSVSIIHYNNLSGLTRLLDSLQKQTYPIDEIVVVDDGSEANCVEQLKQLAGIRLIYLPENRGPGAARNKGLAEASHSTVLQLDGDVVLEKKALAVMIEVLEKNPKADFVVPRMMYLEKPEQIYAEETPFHYLGLGLIADNRYKTVREVSSGNRPICTYGGRAYLIRNKQRCTTYDESLYYTFEDLDFSLRNHMVGLNAYLVTKALAFHASGSTANLSHCENEPYPTQRLFLLIRNRWLIMRKHYQARTIIKSLPLLWLIDGLLMGFSFLKSKDRLVFFKAWLSYRRLLPKALILRKEIQEQRTRSDETALKNQPLRFKESMHHGLLRKVLLNSLNWVGRWYGSVVMGFSEQPKYQSIDFIGIGAAKSGTTWVADMLRQHPDVFIPIEKELKYFDKYRVQGPENPNYKKPIDWYLSFFNKAKPHQLKGEISPGYLYDETAPQKILEFNPNIKLFVVLRQPVDRLYSRFLFLKQKGEIPADITIDQAVKRRPDLLERIGYYNALKRYFDLFPADQIKVLFFDQIKTEPERFLNELETFLGEKPFVPPTIHRRSNVTKKSVSPGMNRCLIRVRDTLKNRVITYKLLRVTKIWNVGSWIEKKSLRPYRNKPKMDAQIKNELQSMVNGDIEKTEALLTTNLSKWK